MVTGLTDKEEISKLLSEVIGQKVKTEEISHRLIFISSLIILLMGVMYSDGQVAASEKKRIRELISQFIPPDSYVGLLAKPIFIGVQKHKLYTNRTAILKLTQTLGISEKLLIISLCYEVAAADGEVAKKEDKYIEIIAKSLDIDPRHLAVISSKVANGSKNVIQNDGLEEINRILDPHQFQDLDPVFMSAASHLRSKLTLENTASRKADMDSSKAKHQISYEKLIKFQKIREQLTEVAVETLEIVRQETHQNILPETTQDDALQVLEKLKSQRFRLAVVGEFSQGKSTLLNALLGEELQPTRAIPCSATVTKLRHGIEENIICRYKNGQEENISINRYYELASISREAALSNISDELSKSEIQEIVFEHPGLELCRYQVEIIDSPGLNEHPERTAITEQLIDNVDAIIFLANASRPLTQGERDLIRSLHRKLQGGISGQGAQNLFVLVNFMDLLRRERDQIEVKELFNRFLQGDSPILTGSEKLHFISAQSALDSILEGRKDEFLLSFEKFTDALQVFLAQERGTLAIQQAGEKLQGLIKESRAGLKQTGHLLEGRVSLSEIEKAKIIGQMGEVSGREYKLRLLHDELVEEAIEAIAESWQEWADGVEERIADKSAKWESSSEEKAHIFRDYSDQFMRDLAEDLDAWLEKSVKESILKPRIQKFGEAIYQELKRILESLKILDSTSGSNLSEQFDLSLSSAGVDINFSSSLDPGAVKERGFLGNLGFIGGAGLAGGLLGFIGIGFLPILLGSFVVGWIFGDDDKHVQMKTQVYAKGFDKFVDQAEELFTKIVERSREAFNLNLESAVDAIECSILILDNLLIQQGKIYEESVICRDGKREYLQQTLSKLDALESKLEFFLNLPEE